jgi:CubicO group peptidase (beta-lactamase class C family)
MYFNNRKQLFCFLNPSIILLLLLSSFFISTLSVKYCYSKTLPEKASYNGLQPDKFMTKWMLLDPVPVFENNQVPQNTDNQKKIFQSDSLLYDKIIASIQPGIYTIGDKKYEWRPINVESDIIDLVEIFGQKEFVYTYAFAEINVAKDEKVLLGIGSDDGVKVWLNGKLIHENWIGRGVNADDDILTTTFKKGKNQLLLKIQNMQLGWGFSSRILSPKLLEENFVFAGWDGNLEKIKKLLANGVNINSEIKPGLTALHCAKIRGRNDITEFLLKNGANQNIIMPAKEKIVDIILNRNIKKNSPGAAIAIAKNGSIVYMNGYGLANLEYDIPITPQTIFHVASVSKQFTAFAITMLADQGKLSLDDAIQKYLPEVPDFGKKITIRHLIYHISGLRDQWELLAMAGWRLDDVITKEQILKMVKHQQDLNFNPGDEFLYCNTGYTLLAEIVERVSGMPFREFAQLNIFKPLGMTLTHFHDDHEMVVKNRSYSYEPGKGNTYKNSVLSYANVGATSLFTTVEDLVKWNQNLDNGLIGGPNVIKQMIEQGILNNGNKLNYAFGLEIGEYKGLKTIGHSGGDAGFRSYTCRFPDQQMSVVVLSNLGSYNPYGAAMEIADIYLYDKFNIQQQKTTEPEVVKQAEVKVSPDIYNNYTGKYELMQGLIIIITKEGDQLMAEVVGQGKAEIFPESETMFFLKVAPIKISFQKDATGTVSQLTLHQNGQESAAKKIKDLLFDTNNLNQYTGDYYSEELGTVYTIVIRDSMLIAQHRRHSDIQLTPTIKDQLTGNAWWFQNVKFTRDENQVITGFKLTGGRVRNLKFVKK